MPSTKSRYHHGDLRAALLHAAVEVLRERGVAGLSLRECARRAGVSHAAPYRHFSNKDALMVAIAAEGFRWLVAMGEKAMADLTDTRERLDAYGVAYVRFAILHPEHHRLMFASELDSSAATPEDLADADAAFELLQRLAGDVAGPEEDSLLAAVAFWSLVHGLSMLILDGRIPPEHIADEAQVDALTRATFAQWRS
ncbi:MAG: TetR/AcrR family transcriptional regulator [Sandaracinaceae bacterium]